VLRGSQRKRGLLGDPGKRRTLLKMRLELSIPIQGALALSVSQLR
jgi:hypothetical protein